jgi:hypothetical protein
MHRINLHKLWVQVLAFWLLMTIVGCHYHDDHHHIDPRYPFLGEYHAIESFRNQTTGHYESYEYDIEVLTKGGNGVEIIVNGYNNGGIYGTSCSLVGEVYDGTHIDIPLNICHYNHQTTFEIDGHGDLSLDGHHLTFDLHIHRCDGHICYDEPAVTISAHRL